MAKSTIQRSIVAAFSDWKQWQADCRTPTPLTKEQFSAVTCGEHEDAIADLLCDVVAFVIDQAGVDAIVAKIPEKWESDSEESPNTKASLAWWWVWYQLIDTGFDS